VITAGGGVGEYGLPIDPSFGEWGLQGISYPYSPDVTLLSTPSYRHSAVSCGQGTRQSECDLSNLRGIEIRDIFCGNVKGLIVGID
jgi:hypothetical protein